MRPATARSIFCSARRSESDYARRSWFSRFVSFIIGAHGGGFLALTIFVARKSDRIGMAHVASSG